MGWEVEAPRQAGWRQFVINLVILNRRLAFHVCDGPGLGLGMEIGNARPFVCIDLLLVAAALAFLAVAVNVIERQQLGLKLFRGMGAIYYYLYYLP